MSLPTTNAIRAATMAARFAQECGLPAGNLWEPGIARTIENDLNNDTAEHVEAQWRLRLFGIHTGNCK